MSEYKGMNKLTQVTSFLGIVGKMLIQIYNIEKVSHSQISIVFFISNLLSFSEMKSYALWAI